MKTLDIETFSADTDPRDDLDWKYLAFLLGGEYRGGGQISVASQSRAEGASEPWASIEEASEPLEEFASMTRRNAAPPFNAKDLLSETSSARMPGMNSAMGDIQSASGNISEIIKTIDEIVLQTSILAANAAVEAAKEADGKIEESIFKSANGFAISSKVTQTNAATAEELNAQAATLRERVVELQNLVTGLGDGASQRSSTRREVLATRPFSPPARRQALKPVINLLQKCIVWGRPRFQTSKSLKTGYGMRLSSDNYKWLVATIKTDPRRQLN